VGAAAGATAALGEGHPATLRAHVALATTYFRMSRFDEADHHMQEVFARFDDVAASDEALRGDAEYIQGWIALGRGDFEGALALFERSRADEVRLHGPESVHVSAASDGIGEALVALGRPHEALAAYRIAIAATHEDARESYAMGYHLMGLGTAQLRSGDAVSAAETLTRALAMLEPRITDAIVLGRTRAALAEALWDQADRRERAKLLAVTARKDLAAGNARARVDLSVSLAWLDAHAP
jgi:tetratricopeptide (TPR) repeat protein